MQEAWVPSLGQEDPLEKEMATHSSIFAWRIPWTEEPGRLQSMGSQESDRTELSTHTHRSYWLNGTLISPRRNLELVQNQMLFETYTQLYVKQIASRKFLYNTRSSTYCSVTT